MKKKAAEAKLAIALTKAMRQLSKDGFFEDHPEALRKGNKIWRAKWDALSSKKKDLKEYLGKIGLGHLKAEEAAREILLRAVDSMSAKQLSSRAKSRYGLLMPLVEATKIYVYEEAQSSASEESMEGSGEGSDGEDMEIEEEDGEEDDDGKDEVEDAMEIEEIPEEPPMRGHRRSDSSSLSSSLDDDDEVYGEGYIEKRSAPDPPGGPGARKRDLNEEDEGEIMDVPVGLIQGK